ncbi:MAG TPA: dienelactone hydrolase family protein [Terriglobales bacterium]|nr:dienelactone hydrolase family protein [Terriglobales bacterium]
MSFLNSLSAFLNQQQVQKTTDSFLSDGKLIRIDRFLPLSEKQFPAVIAIHGSTGMAESFSDQPARMLAGNGYCVFLLHYFDRTGTGVATKQEMHDLFPDWMSVISDSIAYVNQLSQVQPDRVGLIGISLGAYLALSLGATDSRVKAVVDFCGGLPEELAAQCAAMPPTLILHGEKDESVPVAEAHKIERLMQRTNSAYEIKIYPGAGHFFSGPTMLDAAQRTLAFLKKHL